MASLLMTSPWVRQVAIPFDLQLLEKQTPYFEGDVVQFKKPWSVIVYVSEMTCNTCLNRELAHLNDMVHNTHNVDFVLVASGWQPSYLRALRRVGKVNYPIIPERESDSLGFEQRFSISLIDNASSVVVLQYFPETGKPDMFTEFWNLVKRKIED